MQQVLGGADQLPAILQVNYEHLKTAYIDSNNSTPHT